MSNLKTSFQLLIKEQLEVVGNCQNCGGNLFKWKNKTHDGKERCKPTCMDCGHTELIKKTEQNVMNRFEEAKENKIKMLFRNGSIVPNKKMFDCTFYNFKITEVETQQAKEMCERATKEFVKGENIHVVLTGNSGVGKSHLAMAICNEYLNKTEYEKEVLFINFRELIEQMKFAIGSADAEANLSKEIIKMIKESELVVIDDLGAELGEGNERASSRFNSDILYGIMEAREDSPTVFTTNLSGDSINKLYGSRIVSRMLKNSKGYVFKFQNTKDKRITEV